MIILCRVLRWRHMRRTARLDAQPARHLQQCAACVAWLARQRRVEAALQREAPPAEATPAWLTARLLQHARQTPQPQPQPRSRRARGVRPVAEVAAGAAVMAMIVAVVYVASRQTPIDPPLAAPAVALPEPEHVLAGLNHAIDALGQMRRPMQTQWQALASDGRAAAETVLAVVPPSLWGNGAPPP